MPAATKFSPFRPAEMFDGLVPQELQIAIARDIVREYRNAKLYYDTEFRPPEVKDGLPFHRRTCIESMLCDLPAKHPGITIMTKVNRKGNCHHRVLVCGRVMLTQSLVEQEGVLPREAKFRQGYARDPQYLLFGEDDPPDEDAPLYAIITHMPVSQKENGIPAFIDVVFPDQNYKSSGQKIPLLRRYPQVLDHDIAPTPEAEPNIVPAKPRVKQEQI